MQRQRITPARSCSRSSETGGAQPWPRASHGPNCRRCLSAAQYGDNLDRFWASETIATNDAAVPARPLLRRYGSERIAIDCVAVAVRIDLVVLEGVDSAVVVYAICRVIRDRGTAEHHGASRIIQDAIGIVANLIIVEGHGDTAVRRICINASGAGVIAQDAVGNADSSRAG